MLVAPLLVGACSFSTLGAQNAPATTGSLVQPVEVQRPLPPTLAYSDAAKIGQAASAALWEANGRAPDEWTNARTGSSGTLTADSRSDPSSDCFPFSTTVTSLGGVHQYSGSVCRGDGARTVLQIAEAGV